MGLKGSPSDVSIFLPEKDELFERLNASFKAIVGEPEVGLVNLLRNLLEDFKLLKMLATQMNNL